MRIIAHLDMDAFFASLEEAGSEIFYGKPIVVGADPNSPAGEGKGRGVVSTANYKARAYGIHSALPITKAWQLSQIAQKQNKPPVVFLPVNAQRYGEVSEHIMRILQRHAVLVEQTSVDEAYIDLSFKKSLKQGEEICQRIKREILREENLTA